MRQFVDFNCLQTAITAGVNTNHSPLLVTIWIIDVNIVTYDVTRFLRDRACAKSEYRNPFCECFYMINCLHFLNCLKVRSNLN